MVMSEPHDGSCDACSALANARLSGTEITDPNFIERLHTVARDEITVEEMIHWELLAAAPRWCAPSE